MQTTAARAYLQQAVLTASPEKLVVLLYEGALRHLERAIRSMERHDVAATGEALGKAFAIVGELRSTLDHQKGRDIATNLERLYGFVQDRIVVANRERIPAPVEEAREIMATLKEAWDAILSH